jgi:hypothetical protein
VGNQSVAERGGTIGLWSGSGIYFIPSENTAAGGLADIARARKLAKTTAKRTSHKHRDPSREVIAARAVMFSFACYEQGTA